MTVAATDRKAGPFTNNTSAPIVGPFAFTFKIFALTDVKVVRTTTTSATRATETLAYGTDYTVSANLTTQDSSPGGSITLTGDAVAGTGSLLPPGYHLTILSSVSYSQLTALTNYDRFNPTTLNEVHDRAVALTQQLKEQNERTLTVPATSTTDPADFLEDVFEARDTAVQKASEASASAAHAAATAASFDSHVVQKTTEFDSHASSKTSEFDSNASTKTTAFNTNASTKTIAFDSHATRQTNLFDGHVLDQINGLNLHVARTAESITGVAEESRLNVSKAKTWAEGEDCAVISTSSGVVITTSNNIELETLTEVEVLGGTHSAKVWVEKISAGAQSDWSEEQSGAASYIKNKPVIDTETSASSMNAVTNAAVTARINEIWSWIYNQSGWSPILATTSGVDLMTSSTEVILADHA